MDIRKIIPVLFFTLIFIAGIFFAGCGGMKVNYGDPGAVETVTVDYGSTDLQTIAEAMIESLLVHPALEGRPVVYVSRIRNKTSEHIDTEAITDKIKTAMLKSGKV
ncbi:MAG: penicillin-binding protein activator LpoB, partial [bacterium]